MQLQVECRARSGAIARAGLAGDPPNIARAGLEIRVQRFYCYYYYYCSCCCCYYYYYCSEFRGVLGQEGFSTLSSLPELLCSYTLPGPTDTVAASGFRHL